MSWRRFFRRRYWDDERRRELESYLATEIDEQMARGLPADAARAAAYRKLGNPTRIREEIYEMNTIGLLETIWQDLRYGARLLRLNPTFAIVAILTLALGTGANAAIFQLVDAVRLRMLPVKDAQQLVEITIDTNGKGRTGRFISRRPLMTEPLWRAVRERQQAFSEMLAWGTVTFDLASSGESRPAQGIWVSGDFFQTLGVPAHIGRVLTPADDRKGCPAPGVVLSHAFWQKQYSGDPSIVGRAIVLDGHPFDIVGVSQAGFFGVDVGRTFDVAAPICAEPITRGARTGIDKRDVWFLDVLGRLKEGWTTERAEAQLQSISPSLFQATAPTTLTPVDTAELPRVQVDSPIRPDRRVVDSRRVLDSALGPARRHCRGPVDCVREPGEPDVRARGRAVARGRDPAGDRRVARSRLVRQMLCESLLLAALGSTGGWFLAQWFSRGLVAFLNTDSSSRVFVDLAPGLAGVRFHVGADRPGVCAVRTDARPSHHAHEPGRHDEGGWARGERWP